LALFLGAFPVEFLKKIVANAAVRKAALALVLAVLAAAGFSLSGCSLVGLGAKSPALTAFECRAAVFAPLVAEAAPLVSAQIAAGAINPVEFLLSLGLTPEEIVAVAKAYQACEPPAVEAPPAPAPVLLRTAL
jgi:hypothetical protein